MSLSLLILVCAVLFKSPGAASFTSPLVPSCGTCRGTALPLPTRLLADVNDATEESVEEEIVAEDESPNKRVIQRERHTLFVGNLPFVTSDAELRDLFSQHGTVELVSIPINKENGKARGFAFVDMSSQEEVQAAIENLSGTDVGGRSIRVSESLPKDQAKKQVKVVDEGAQKIYVGNFPFDATEEDVKELYSKYGNVRDVYFPKKRDTGEPRGFAFVTLDEEVAEKAIEETNGMDFMGRPLVVSLPLPPGERGARRQPRQKLYIGNLSFYTVPDTLRELFEEFGPVHDCYMPEDPDTGGSRGFGFVTMDKDAAMAAVDATDGCELDGRPIRVNEAQPKGSFVPRRNEEDEWNDEGDY